MDPFDLDSIISVFENLIPGGGGHPHGNVIFMGPGMPGNHGDGDEPPCNQGDCQGSSPRDDVLKKPPNNSFHRHGFGNFGDVIRRDFPVRGQEPPVANNQRDEVLKHPSEVQDPRRQDMQVRGFPSFGGAFRDEFDEFADIFLPDFFDPFSRGQRQHFFDDFGSLRGEDPFDPFSNFHRRQQNPRQDVDMDQDQGISPMDNFFKSSQSSSNYSFSSNGCYKKTSTFVDSHGNKRVTTTTRDRDGVEREVVERHLADGTVERIEKSNCDVSSHDDIDDVMATRSPRNDVVTNQKPFDPYKYLKYMRKPLYDEKIFRPEFRKEEEEEVDEMKMEDYKHQDSVGNFIPMTFKKLLKHFLHGD